MAENNRIYGIYKRLKERNRDITTRIPFISELVVRKISDVTDAVVW